MVLLLDEWRLRREGGVWQDVVAKIGRGLCRLKNVYGSVASFPVGQSARWIAGTLVAGSLETERSYMQDFRNIDAWCKAHGLVLSVYRESLNLPKEEVFGLTIQLRRNATAIATRIAEGAGRSTATDFAVDLRRSAVSCNELEYLIVLAKDLNYWKPEVAESLIADTVEVRKILFGLLRTM